MDKFKNKYRIPSARLRSWNYGNNGTYFITICTKNRIHYFGEIVGVGSVILQNKMQFTPLGKHAYQCALDIPQHFPFVELDEFVIMPNHIHLLFTIDKTEMDDGMIETQNFAFPREQPQNHFGPQSKNVASIVRGFKIGVTKYAHNNQIDFAWQTRFYDHIVRDVDAYERIRNYIFNNVNNWEGDSLNSKILWRRQRDDF